MGRFEEAEIAFQKALFMRPHYSDLEYSLWLRSCFVRLYEKWEQPEKLKRVRGGFLGFESQSKTTP